MRRAIGVSIITAILLVIAFPASASSPHFKRGGQPTCTISGGGTSKSVVCSASLTGLGNEDLDIDLTVGGFAVYQCQNAGGNIAPGQNKVLVGPVTAPTTIPADQIKNGNVSFTTNPATLTAPSTVTGAEAGCPNPHWTGVNPTLTVTSITLDISQGGTLLFHCTASNQSGLSSPVALGC